MTTSTELIQTEPAGVPTPYELSAMSTQTLRGELARALTMTAHTLRRLAAIWRELERRGEDLTDLRTGLAVYLPMVAAGQLSADAVIRFAGQPLMLRTISTLPPEQQESLARGDVVEVLTQAQDGTWTGVQISAHAMTMPQARLLIGPGGLRSVEEQRAQVESAKVTKARSTRLATESRVRFDPKTDTIRIGNVKAPAGEVIGAIAAAAHPPAQDVEMTAGLVVKMTEVEHKALKLRATQAGMSLQAYARALLVMQSVV